MFKSYLILLAFVASTCGALEFAKLQGKTAGGKLQDSAVETAWSKGAACLKDGSKVIGVNSAYSAAFKTTKACGKGDRAILEQQAIGTTVTVIVCKELSKELFKKYCLQ